MNQLSNNSDFSHILVNTFLQGEVFNFQPSVQGYRLPFAPLVKVGAGNFPEMIFFKHVAHVTAAAEELYHPSNIYVHTLSGHGGNIRQNDRKFNKEVDTLSWCDIVHNPNEDCV